MKKRIRLAGHEGPTKERCQHSAFLREMMTQQCAPMIPRYRSKPLLTSVEVRREILEDIAAKPEDVRLRSIRRRLTALDRALTEEEAELLERLTGCINDLSNIGCLDLSRSQIRSDPVGRLPFGETKRREISAASFVLRHIGAENRQEILTLAAALDPGTSQAKVKSSEIFIAKIKEIAPLVVRMYGRWKEQHAQNERARTGRTQTPPLAGGNG